MPVQYFEYCQRSGEFNVVLGDNDTPMRVRVFIANGYAGTKEGRNNPDLQHKIAVGPIPRGHWTVGRPFNHARLGQFAIPLTEQGRQASALGRSGFFIHGDSAKNPGDASRGCIILHRHAREVIHALNTLWDDVPLFVKA